MSDDGLRELLVRWQAGWATARDYRSGVDGEVVTVDIGLPDRMTETIVLSTDPELYELVAERVAEPGHWLTAPTADRARTEVAAAGAGFTPVPPEWLMSRPLDDHPRHEPPDGYETWLSGREPMIVAEVVTTGGPDARTLAAKGHLALSGEGADAVADRIFTVPEHRRRGLGSVVMGALTTAARERGARHGLLVASQDGRRLYERLGWRVEAQMATARWTGNGAPAAPAGAVA
ncbi:GNAT family N-acetyltransferase [Jiangella alkaliphila]|uniref:Acetyltransferase (GNAT) family protein n=1 Tax=Jiangella alkaliphila TaxID=419479 RepID=A0A1H2KV86_9ACTN|nr:GNAT family N-acetyltransferase [Jiangella alkaliphila]SDU72268.1 Acetyltransferase (GNAT) family protein [Jiangella alkaliphila]